MMRRAILTPAALLCAVLAGCSGAAKSGDVMAQFSSTSNPGQTARFAPHGAWDLEYSWTCARAQSEGLPGAKGIDLVVYNSDDGTTASEHPEARSDALQGKDVLHFQRSGDYYVGLQTRCDWDVSVVDRSG